ncbi:DUF58 domain-containing protein [Petroclostridium sp. X23]|uniref:DUF58 domain-containing protein n=1 Tax=Petroclostridium sp. X23 TaxID=3045146 RepID=UPI0024AD8AE3|nr:DUF58 domain-containing protein [Petroclostridium sp. X23]WHH58113.1 DUF58 domain-containing protein [Petroclostridium sp. X23]
MGVTSRMVLLVCAGGIFLLSGMYLHLHISIFIVYNTVLAGVYLLDLKMSPQQKDFTIHRKYDDVFEIGKEKKVSLCIFNASGRAVVMQLKDTVPVDWKPNPSLITLNCAAGQDAAGHYTVCPNKRGSYALGNIFVRYSGVLGLCTKQFQVLSGETVPVYPDLYPMKKYHLMSQKRILNKDDAAAHKVFGIGTDFQYLREYTSDDEYRKINWKASARAHRLITGVYDVEKNQNVIICIDTGRTMMPANGNIVRLDYCIQSALVLAQVAIDKGDQVGVLIFGNEVKKFIKPAKGPAQMHKILQGIYGIQPEHYESDFNELVSYLQTYQRKRSLVCIFSNQRDEENGKELAAVLQPLNKKHVLFMVSILDPGLKKLLNRPVRNQQDTYIKAAAVYRIGTEQNASVIMTRMGVKNIMTEPHRLTPEVVNRYIALKKVMRIS